MTNKRYSGVAKSIKELCLSLSLIIRNPITSAKGVAQIAKYFQLLKMLSENGNKHKTGKKIKMKAKNNNVFAWERISMQKRSCMLLKLQSSLIFRYCKQRKPASMQQVTKNVFHFVIKYIYLSISCGFDTR
jgi:hypothetical protein